MSESMGMSIVDRVGLAIANSPTVWLRHNDLGDVDKWELCRYGLHGEPEIVVLAECATEREANSRQIGLVRQLRASAAIAALREPSEAMLKAGREANPFGGTHENWTPGQIVASTVWREMLNAALSE